MTVNYNPSIRTDDRLEFALDFQHPKLIQETGKLFRPQDHGISNWVCMESGTATVAFLEPSTTMYQIDTNGIQSVFYNGPSNPDFVNLSINVGYQYWANKPIHMFQREEHQRLVPLTMAGTMFIHRSTRSFSPTSYYLYSPFEDAEIIFKDTLDVNDAGDGLLGSQPTVDTITLNKQTVLKYDVNTGFGGFRYFNSSVPIVMTATGSGTSDHTIMTPAGKGSYYGQADTSIDVVGQVDLSPTGPYGDYRVSNVANVTNQIADGAGSDSNQGLAPEYLNNRFIFGEPLSDYTIVSPYSDTINAYYYNGGWVLFESHNVSGTETSPVTVARSGTDGVGIQTNVLLGGGTDLPGDGTITSLWKFESTNPFLLRVNDAGANEMNVMGWNSDRGTRSFVSYLNYATDLTTTHKMYPANTTSFENFNGVRVADLNGVSDHISIPHWDELDIEGNGLTINVWVYNKANNSKFEGIITKNREDGGSSRAVFGIWKSPSNKIYYRVGTGDYLTDFDAPVGEWMHLALTWISGGPRVDTYFNGERLAAITIDETQTPINIPTKYPLKIGAAGGTANEYFDGKIGAVSVYKEPQSTGDTKRYYNALKKRFGHGS